MNWKRVIAREWLILVGCWAGAFVLGVLAVVITESFDPLSLPKGIPLAIYAIVQFVRATFWAIRTLRRT